ncbi:MAG: hypothetical protein U5J99_10485 [Parvularculaceae bacterium]|nr:hypothetical protein [Parvularculaceae bacterium]
MNTTTTSSVAMRAILAAALLPLAAACEKKAEDAAPAPTADIVAEEPVSEPMVEAETMVEDAAPIGSANVTVTLTNGAPAFGAVSEGACAVGGGSCVSGVNLNAAGNVDLSGFPAGDITINVNLDASVTGAGYSFPSDPYQAVAIVVIPAGTITAPIPVFGQANWPAEFDAPSVSSAALSFVDKEDDQKAYEYSIQLQGPNGMLVMDPKIQGGGSGGNK